MKEKVFAIVLSVIHNLTTPNSPICTTLAGQCCFFWGFFDFKQPFLNSNGKDVVRQRCRALIPIHIWHCKHKKTEP